MRTDHRLPIRETRFAGEVDWMPARPLRWAKAAVHLLACMGGFGALLVLVVMIGALAK